jgi:hypothetical protein
VKPLGGFDIVSRGRFEAPIKLPGAGDLVLGVAALAAVLERTLRFKSNRWLG